MLVNRIVGEFWVACCATGIPCLLQRAAGLRVEVDDRTESLNRKIREAQLAKTPLILTCGAKEQEAGTVSVRTLDGTVRYGIPMARFMEQVTAHVSDRGLELDLFGD